MKPTQLFILFCLLSFSVSETWAGELRQLYRGARQMAMGGAYTAVADDEQALFLNPAGLATIEDSKLHLVVADLSLATGVVDGWRGELGKTKSINSSTLNSFMGKTLSLRAQGTPSIITPGFGIGMILDAQVALYLRNKVMPEATIGYQNTNGVQFGFAHTFGSKQSRSSGSQFSAGIAGKLLWRRGGYRKLSMLELLNLNKDLRARLTGNFQGGYGVDFGGLYKRKLNQFVTLGAGASWLDFGDTTFGNGPEPQKNNLNFGISSRFDLTILHVLLAYDYRNVLQETDWRKKSHLGLEVGVPLVTVYAGFNQVYPTYGARVNVWLASVTAAVYTEEQGSFAFQIPEKRWMVRADVKIPF